MKLKCLIVDDEPIARKLLEEYVSDIDFLELQGKVENPIKAAAFLKGNSVDLIFLDVNMPQVSGIDFLRTNSVKPMTIMTTAYTEYAIDSFDLNVMDYLVKPFSFERFRKACNKAKDLFSLQHRKNDTFFEPHKSYFFVKCDRRIEKIFYDELLYVEAMQNYVVLHTENKKFIVYLTIKSIVEQLPPQIFLKIHKSTIVNVDKIKSILGNEISVGKSKLLISKTLHETVLQEILKDRLIKR